MTEDERAIRNLVDTWMQATRAGDGAAVLDLMTEDAVFMVPGREPFGRQAFAEATQGMRGGSVEARSEIRELKVLGDWAYMRSYIEVTVTPSQGPSVPRAGQALTILRKEADGKWRLARDANLLTARA